MPKFPDPTKNPGTTPVGGPVPLAKDQPVYQAPPAFPPSPAVAALNQNKNGTPPPAGSSPSVPPISPQPPPINHSPSPSPFRNLIPLIIGLAAFGLLAVLGFTLLPRFLHGGTDEPVVLSYWGLWEPASVMQGVIADYERDHPNVKINYQMQSPKNYRSRLQSAIESGQGPDIARIHNTWLPMLSKSLSPAPQGLINPSEFYPIVSNNFVLGGELYAVPLEIDGLALYYNQDILAEAGAEPPTDWNAFRKLAFDLTRRNPETGIIERAGAALGTTNNIDHWSDILGLLILQNSGDPGNPSDPAVADALTFFTLFSVSDKSWDTSQPNSTYAFATGTLAMMLAPAWHAAEIDSINPTLNFGIAPAPRLVSPELNWATYWAEAVSSSSQNPEAAWRFLAYLSSNEVLQKLYTTQSQIRVIGEPYPKPALAEFLVDDPLAAPFVSQGSTYTSWYLSDRTYDEGVNDEFIKYYEDAVNAINDGSGVSAVTKTLESGAAQVKSKYNLR